MRETMQWQMLVSGICRIRRAQSFGLISSNHLIQRWLRWTDQLSDFEAISLVRKKIYGMYQKEIWLGKLITAIDARHDYDWSLYIFSH